MDTGSKKRILATAELDKYVQSHMAYTYKFSNVLHYQLVIEYETA